MAIRLICCLEDEHMNHLSAFSKRFGVKLLCLFDHPISCIHMIGLQILQPINFMERILLDWFDVLALWQFLGPERMETVYT
jgi:hypothetical protein